MTQPPDRTENFLAVAKSKGASIIQSTIKSMSLILLGLVLVAGLWLVSPFVTNRGSAQYADIDEHFRYASIGGEDSNGLPYWLWRVLPTVFADKLPGNGYESLGFIKESDHELPIGFARSTNRLGLAVVTQNCATCHVGSVRESATGDRHIISTMPSNTVNLGEYIRFLSDVAVDKRFSARELMPYILESAHDSGTQLNPLEQLIYRFLAIPQARDGLLRQRNSFAFLDRQTDYGPGRVDTFTPYKALRFNFPMDQIETSELNGIADFPSIWQQRPREGMQLHWDGDNDSVDERNNSAALALVTPTTINFDSIYRVRDWLMDLPAPKYPWSINEELAHQGEVLFQNNCASCHAFDGAYVGKVVPIEEIGTDPGRLDSYTYELASNQYTLFSGISYRGKDQRFTHFRKTNGYASMPLDGLWLRAPYLHNGSVPTLWDLLEVPEKRPSIFYRGYDVFDQDKVGFVFDVAEEDGKQIFQFDTTQPGNGNGGHLYGVNLEAKEKTALVEYLKTL